MALNQIKSIGEHCHSLVRLLNELQDFDDYSHIVDWLHVSAGINAVGFDTSYLDPGLDYCSGAARYESNRDQILESMVHQLSIFSFVWGSLESLLNSLDYPALPGRPKNGKIREACWYLKNRFEPKPLIYPYLEQLGSFYEQIREEQMREILSKGEILPKLDEETGFSGLGLAMVYKLRNEFAHGSLSMPLPDEENEPQFLERNVIACATRIVLLSIQMLIAAKYKDLGITIDHGWEGGNFQRELPLDEALRTLHFTKPKNRAQLELFDDRRTRVWTHNQ